METPDQHIQDLIVELFCGEIDEVSLAELLAWSSASPDNRRYLQEEQEIWFSSVSKKSLNRFDSNAAYKLFLQRVADRRRKEIDAESEKSGNTLGIATCFPRWARYAAAAVLVFAAVGFAFQKGQENTASQLTDITIEAPQGSQTRTCLPDGTIVWLNAGSTLTYPQAYGLKDRTVSLSGEACFKIHHDSHLPFCVNTKNIRINDIGTRFNLRDYPSDDEVEIVLEEGAVKLENKLNNNSTTVMSPGQRAVIDKNTGKLHMDKTDATNVSQWTTGRLVLNGENLTVIAQKIERYYGVKVVIDSNSQNDGRFFGEFSKREDSLNDVLRALTSTHKLKYRRKGNTIILY